MLGEHPFCFAMDFILMKLSKLILNNPHLNIISIHSDYFLVKAPSVYAMVIVQKLRQN